MLYETNKYGTELENSNINAIRLLRFLSFALRIVPYIKKIINGIKINNPPSNKNCKIKL